MSVATFIPQLWSARLLEHLDNALVAKEFFNNDYEGEIQDCGDTVKINQIGNITISDYNRNQDMDDPEELGTTVQELIVDQAKAFNFQVDDVDRVQMKTDLMDKAMTRAAYALASVEDTFLFNKLLAEAGEQIARTGILTPDDAFSLLIQMRTVMKTNNVPAVGRKLAAPPEFTALLLEDKRFTGTGGSMAEETLQSGLIGRAMGFDIYEVNTLPEGRVVAGHQIAGTYANQLVKTKAYEMEKRFADGVKGLSVYGAKTLVPEALVAAEFEI